VISAGISSLTGSARPRQPTGNSRATCQLHRRTQGRTAATRCRGRCRRGGG